MTGIIEHSATMIEGEDPSKLNNTSITIDSDSLSSSSPQTQQQQQEFGVVDTFKDVAAVDRSFSWLQQYTEPFMTQISNTIEKAMAARTIDMNSRANVIRGSPILAGMLLMLIVFVAVDIITLLLHSYTLFTMYEMSCFIVSLLLLKLFSLQRIRRAVLNQIVSRQREEGGMKLIDGLTVIAASILSYAISETGSWVCVFTISIRFLLREIAYVMNVLILIETFSELIVTAFIVLYCITSHAVSDNLAVKLSKPLLRGRV